MVDLADVHVVESRDKEKRKHCQSVLEITPERFFMSNTHAGGRSHRRQNRRRNRCDNLHNPLKSFFLRHTL